MSLQVTTRLPRCYDPDLKIILVEGPSLPVLVHFPTPFTAIRPRGMHRVYVPTPHPSVNPAIPLTRFPASHYRQTSNPSRVLSWVELTLPSAHHCFAALPLASSIDEGTMGGVLRKVSNVYHPLLVPLSSANAGF